MAKLPLEARLEVTVGKKSVDKLIDAVVDTFSPASEFAGMLGDAVRLGRVEMAAHVTRRAKEIADENGLVLKAPPLKFLVPFYEKASLEDKDRDPELTEMWSNLLVSASLGHLANHSRFSAILSEIDKRHVDILNLIVLHGDSIENFEKEHVIDRLYGLSSLEVADDLRMGLEVEDVEDAFARIEEMFNRKGIIIRLAVVCDISGDPYYDADDYGYKDDDQTIYEALRSLGLIDVISTSFVRGHNFDSLISFYYITLFGLEFWTSCNAAPLKGSN